MFKIPQKVKSESLRFSENLNKLIKGELKEPFFKGIRVPWGFYSQRGGRALMSRLRVPGSILSPRQIKAVGNAAENFASGKLHITTRQDIQIHDLPYANVSRVIEFLGDYEISPRGGGGNTVRNITTCPLSGICPKEKIEVNRLVIPITEYLLSVDDSFNLPRKLKFAFSGCQKDCASCGVNDVGFVATQDGFKVLCGGGLGAKSSVGRVLAGNVPADEVIYILRAVMSVFNKYGDRKNRHRNRLRFLIEDLGWEKFKELYNGEFEKVKNEEYIFLDIKDNLPSLSQRAPSAGREYCDESFNEFLKFSTGRQKQSGYSYATLNVSFGEIAADKLFKLADLEQIFPALIFRTTQRQNIILTNIPSERLYELYSELKLILTDFLYPDTIYDIVSCKAATTCNLGICDAMSLAPVLVGELKKLKPDLEKFKNFKININGCPNACGQHPLGNLSFSGAAKKVFDRTAPFYKVYINGSASSENTRLASDIGIIPARNIPIFFSELISALPGADTINESEAKTLIRKHSHIPSYDEDREYYVDFGKTGDFSLEGLSQGECGAGVIDMLESDIESARQSLAKARDNDYAMPEIKNAVVFAARALLVVKGIDATGDIEAVKSFSEKFPASGIVKPDFKNIVEVYEKIVSEDIKPEDAFKYASALFEEVTTVYSGMDANFNFKPRFASEVKRDSKYEEKVSSTYDLRGTPCPINYVKTKLMLEEMSAGDILEVLLDEGPPIENVPKSLKNDGQEILKIEKSQNFYKMLVKKRISHG